MLHLQRMRGGRMIHPTPHPACHKKLQPLVVWLLLLVFVATPVAAQPLADDPESIGDPETGFVEWGQAYLNGLTEPAAPVVTSRAPAAPTTAAQAVPAGDLPSYEEEALGLFNAANSVEIIRHMSMDIGPRLSGTPQEAEGAAYLGSLLQSYGYAVTYPTFAQTSTRNVARVTSPSATLPGGPNWQMSSSTSAKVTGDDSPVRAEVIYAGNGQSAANFPADTAGKIVMMDYSSNATTRNTAVVNAVARGAVGVILAQTGPNASPPSPFALTTPQPDVPVAGGGRAHLDWINGLLGQGPLTLEISTNRYIAMPGVNVIGVRVAAGDSAGASAPIVMVGAHHDSVLGAPGADDNLSGTAVYMEIARVLSRYTFDKEIRIGGYGNEEGGLRGSGAYVAALTAEEKARFVGSWVMDMVGTTNPPARPWVHTLDGNTNYIIESAYAAAARIGLPGLQNCIVSGSDHEPFSRAGIPSAVFSWMNYVKRNGACLVEGSLGLEPQYHKPTDTLADNISQERLQDMLNLVGSSVFHSALNAVTLTETPAGSSIEADCGDGGWRYFGATDAAGALVAMIPHATCDLRATGPNGVISRLEDVAISGDRTLAFPPIFAPTVSPNPVLLHGSATATANVTFAGPDATAACATVDTGSVGAQTVTCTVTDNAGAYSQTAPYNVVYAFAGFTQPVANPPASNPVNAGQTIPLKWRIADANNAPVTDLASVVVTATGLACQLGSTADQPEEHAPGASGLLNLGSGYYQFNWQTPWSYARSCKTLRLDLGEGPGMERTALFQFVK